MKNRLLKRTQVEALTSLSRSCIYSEMQAGRFPKPLKVSSKAVRWREMDIFNWMESLPHTGEAADS
ncbi:MAG: AlpA family phage regulatory protein [Gammaproteobacteria bacterium]|nr:AlpA family phage regulatory protein [Gammaproteobacteria bacterium]